MEYKDYKDYYENVNKILQQETDYNKLLEFHKTFKRLKTYTENIRYRTFHVLGEGDELLGNVVVASRPTDETKKQFVIGAAFYSKPGKSKKYFQNIAKGRMNCDRTNLIINKQEETPLTWIIKDALPNLPGKGVKWFQRREAVV